MWEWVLGIAILIIALNGVRIIRPTNRGIVERFGKYNGFREPGFHWIIPVIDRMIQVNITERLSDVMPQDIITKDNLNARVDLMVYYKVMEDEVSIKKSLYNVNSFKRQIVALAQTTARNVIGDMNFTEVNNQRNKLNGLLAEVLDKESDAWGVRIVRVELKEITPPHDVQETMNMVIKAENDKQAAIDFATATETKADGDRRAIIKKAEGNRKARILEAEGIREAKILKAEGESKAFKLIDESFKGNAQLLEKLKVTENSLKDNTKIVLPENAELVNVIGNLAGGVLPLKKKGQ